MEQLHVAGAVSSMQRLCVVQKSRSKHLCGIGLLTYCLLMASYRMY